MPSIASSTRMKRLLCELNKRGKEVGNDDHEGIITESSRPSRKKPRVRFDDNLVKISRSNITPETNTPNQEKDAVVDDRVEDEEEVDFVLSIGDDGDLDYTIITSSSSSSSTNEYVAAGSDKKPSAATNNHAINSNNDATTTAYPPSSEQIALDRRLSDQDAQDELSSFANNDDDDDDTSKNHHRRRTVSMEASTLSYTDESYNNDIITMEPLITPPSSPKRVCTLLDNGDSEEATICEWPCNLTVDIAITAALESVPSYSRSFSSVDIGGWDD